MSKHFYVFVRSDMPVADQICQVAHACHEAGNAFPPHNSNLVLLSVANVAELIKVAEICDQNNICQFTHVEPDDDLGATALCTQSIDQSQRRLFRKYKLWK